MQNFHPPSTVSALFLNGVQNHSVVLAFDCAILETEFLLLSIAHILFTAVSVVPRNVFCCGPEEKVWLFLSSIIRSHLVWYAFLEHFVSKHKTKLEGTCLDDFLQNWLERIPKAHNPYFQSSNTSLCSSN